MVTVASRNPVFSGKPRFFRPAVVGNSATLLVWICALSSVLASTGCQTVHAVPLSTQAADWSIPRELEKASLPSYVIEPPDVILIEAVKTVPEAPYHIEPLDALIIRGTQTFPDQEIDGVYVVDEQGMVDLGPAYNLGVDDEGNPTDEIIRYKVAGLTVQEAQRVIQQQMRRVVREAQVSVSLAEPRGPQEIFGEHLVRPDGTVSLGIYGAVRVAGLTLQQAEKVIEEHLLQHLEEPDVFVDVIAYNSKVCYVILDGAGFGEQVARLPITGNETVLDAISAIGGLPPSASKRSEIWVARPAPPDAECSSQTLPVDWVAITQEGSPATNYQLFPGDRIYIKADSWVALDGFIAKVTAPVERILGFTLLGAATHRDLRFIHVPPVVFQN